MRKTNETMVVNAWTGERVTLYSGVSTGVDGLRLVVRDDEGATASVTLNAEGVRRLVELLVRSL